MAAMIEVKDIYKSFKIPHEKTNSIRSAVRNIFKNKTYTTYDAARGISFEVQEGEFLGIIGKNGSGKSTMLKMLAGIYVPDSGTIKVSGRLSPFLELGVGFNPELTARENVFLNGVILGLTRKEISEKFDEIIAFAELEEFVDQKLKNFSSGMQVRLAFSVAIQAHADILLIDEVLAVGDGNFQNKCFEVFRNLKKAGKTIVFVSHGMDNVREFCDRVVFLKDGKLKKVGKPDDVIFEYEKTSFESSNEEFTWLSKREEFGDGTIQLAGLDLIRDNKKSDYIKTGEDLALRISYKNPKGVESANFAVGIYDVDGTYCFGIDTKIDGTGKLKLKKSGQVDLKMDQYPLLSGDYIVNVSAFDDNIAKPFHFVRNFLKYKTLNDDNRSKYRGIVDINHKWEVK